LVLAVLNIWILFNSMKLSSFWETDSHSTLWDFQVLTAASMKISAFWDVTLYRLVEIDRHQDAEEGGSTHLWNIGLLQWDCTALYPRKLSLSFT
jgi:hypothetical protein